MATSRVQCFAGYSITQWDANSRLFTTHDRGYVLVSYETPVAVYDRETDVLCVTDDNNPKGAGSLSTKRHIKDFTQTFRPGAVRSVPQVYITGLLNAIVQRG